jgi:hypothetical protein
MTSKADEYRELLDPFIVSTVPADNGDYEAYCPAHENPGISKKPSARINFSPENKVAFPNGIIYCFVCGFTGKHSSLDNAVKLYLDKVEAGVQFGKVERNEKTKQFKSGKKHDLPSEETRQDYEEALLENIDKLEYLKNVRGLNKTTIKKFHIGWNATRRAYTYPVLKDGTVYAMRLYRPTSKELKHSWYNSKTEHTPQLFGTEGLENEPIVILTEGEFDTMLAQQDGFKAVTHNGGAGKFLPSWAPWFKNKVVYIAYDADPAGNSGRNTVARILKDFARAIYFVDFPGDRGTDYTDFRVRDKHTREDFQALLDESKKSGPETENVATDGLPLSGKPVTIAESIGTAYIGIPLEMRVQVLGRFDPPYVVPARIHLECSADKGEKFCSVCPMQIGHMDVEIAKDSEFIQRVVGARESEVDRMILQEAGVKCKDRITDIDRAENWSVEQIVVGESVETRRDDQETHALAKSDTNLVILSVDSSDSGVNEIYRVVGHQKPSPKDQRLAFTAWHREQTKTNIDQFAMDPSIYEELTTFQPSARQGVFRKMWHIAHDLTTNVAGVVDREELAMAYDVAWHSALAFNFGGKLDDRGWVELLVFGDTRTGKSETAHRLAAHYRNGKVFSSEGATRAGLVGGATQPNGSKHWIATWGSIPQNDRRLIVLDEAQALVDIVKDMGSIRSKGVAEMVKVGINQSTLARTRLIWICNPLTQGKLDEFADGAMTALAEFMPASEDRARFDLACAVSSSDVADTQIYAGIRKDRKQPTYSSEACEKLILWAWSRTPEQIIIPKSVESHVLNIAKEIVAKYDKGNFELVQGSNLHVKLARISVACAARVFSTDETGELLVVENRHVDAAREIMEQAYDNDAMGLGRASKRAKKDSKMALSHMDQVRTWLRTGHAAGMPTAYGTETFRALRTSQGRLKVGDFTVMTGLGMGEAIQVISHLSELGVLKHETSTRDVVLSRELIDLLRSMEEEDDERD